MLPPASLPGNGTTRIWVGGAVTSVLSGDGNPFLFGQVNNPSTNTAACMGCRTFGKLLMPLNFGTATGSAFFGAATSFQSGELWSANQNQLACVALQPVPLITANSSTFPSCNAYFETIGSSAALKNPPCASITPRFSITTTTGSVTLGNPMFAACLATCNDSSSHANGAALPIGFCDVCRGCRDLALGAGAGSFSRLPAAISQ